MVPINVLSAYLADYFLFRVLAVTLHFGAMYLAAIFASRLISRDVTLLMFIAMVILHPLDFQHLPPNSYALQNSIPFIVILCIRIWIWDRWDRPETLRWPSLLLAYCGFAAAMLINEYGTILGAAALLAEYVSLTSSRYKQSRNLFAVAVMTAKSKRLWLDTISIFTTLAIYSWYRFINQSTYNGHTLDGLHRYFETWTTLFLHTASATIFTRLNSAFLENSSANIIVIVCVYLAGWLMFVFFKTVEKPKMRPKEAAYVIATSVVLVIIIVLPIAGAAKYQDWCAGIYNCAYLDSRTALYPIGAIVTALILAISSLTLGNSGKFFLNRAIALLMAIVSSLTYLNNWTTEQEMHTAVAGWDRASAITCVPNVIPSDDDDLVKLVDPERRILIHPHLSIEEYWRRYIEVRRNQVDCDGLSPSTQHWLTRISGHYLQIGNVLSFANVEPGKALVSGWNRPERWGIWSDGMVAELRIVPANPDIDVLGFRFNLFPPPTYELADQSVSVFVNGRKSADWSLNPGECGARVIKMVRPLPAERESRIVFKIASPTSPKSIGIGGDKRQLGIGLISLTPANWSELQISRWINRQC